jgi:hypothetical protein
MEAASPALRGGLQRPDPSPGAPIGVFCRKVIAFPTPLRVTHCRIEPEIYSGEPGRVCFRLVPFAFATGTHRYGILPTGRADKNRYPDDARFQDDFASFGMTSGPCEVSSRPPDFGCRGGTKPTFPGSLLFLGFYCGDLKEGAPERVLPGYKRWNRCRERQ